MKFQRVHPASLHKPFRVQHPLPSLQQRNYFISRVQIYCSYLNLTLSVFAWSCYHVQHEVAPVHLWNGFWFVFQSIIVYGSTERPALDTFAIYRCLAVADKPDKYSETRVSTSAIPAPF